MFQELLIGTSGLPPLLGEEQAFSEASSRALMLCCGGAWMGVSVTWAVASGRKAGGHRGMRRAWGLACPVFSRTCGQRERAQPG